MYLSGVAQLELLDDVVPHAPRRARRERRDGTIGKALAQPAQLPILRPEFVAPFRDAMRLVDRKQRNRDAREPFERIRARQPLRRNIQQAVSPVARLADQFRLLRIREHAIQRRGLNPHLRELRHLILHQRDQRRNHDHGLPGKHRRGKLVAERFPSAGRHHHARVAIFEQAPHDAVLQRTKRIVSPIAPQRRQKFPVGNHSKSIDVRAESVDIGRNTHAATVGLRIWHRSAGVSPALLVFRPCFSSPPPRSPSRPRFQIAYRAGQIRIKIEPCSPRCFPRSGAR